MKAILAFLCLWLFSLPAEAHKLNIFVQTEGPVISGYAYYSAKSRAKNIEIFIETAEGERVFEGTTDEEGAFRYQSQSPQDHIVTVISKDGHKAVWQIKADLLKSQSEPVNRSVDGTLHREIAKLREEIHLMRKEREMRDILSSLGFIIGLGGVSYGFMMARKYKN